MGRDSGLPELAGDYPVGGFIPGANVVIKEVIGRGGQGTVYGGEMAVPDPEGSGFISLGKQVALKVIHPHLAGDLRMIRSLIAEAGTLGTLNHPNIVNIFAAGFTADNNKLAYIAMEKLEGISGRELLKDKNRLPLQNVLEVSVGLASGLAAAHQRGIVHQDIKPENIFVHISSEGRAFPKLFDWGIRRITSEKVKPDPSTMVTSPSAPPAAAVGATLPPRGAIEAGAKKAEEAPRTYQGTPAYSAPEQFQGEPATPRTDVYAFGVTLFELLAGYRPFHRAEQADQEAKSVPGAGWSRVNRNLIDAKLKEDAPKLSRALAVPPKLEALVGRCLARDPALRPADAGELETELKEILTNLHPYFRDDAGAGLSTQEFLVSAVKSARDSSSHRIAPKDGAPEAPLAPADVPASPEAAPRERHPGFAQAPAPSILGSRVDIPAPASGLETPRPVRDRRPGFGDAPLPSIVASSVNLGAFASAASAEPDALAAATAKGIGRGEPTKTTLEGVAPIAKTSPTTTKKGAIVGLVVVAAVMLAASVTLVARATRSSGGAASSSPQASEVAATVTASAPVAASPTPPEPPAAAPRPVSADVPASAISPTPPPPAAPSPPTAPAADEQAVTRGATTIAAGTVEPQPTKDEGRASDHKNRAGAPHGAPAKSRAAPTASGNPSLTKLLN